MRAQLAIIIVNWNQTESTCRCLRALADFETLRPDLWVVDNASEDGGIATLANRFPAVHVIANRVNLGFGAANNQALRECAAPFALLLNNDAHIREVDLVRMIDALEADPHLAAAGPAITAGPDSDEIIALGGRDVSRHIRTHLRPEDLAPRHGMESKPMLVRYIPGAIALLRTAVLEKTGFFEERYFFGGELADFCEVAADHGYATAVIPSARGWHDMSESGSLRQELYPYYILRNRFLFIFRHRRRLLIPLVLMWIAYGLASAGRDLARGNLRRARLSWLALADALRGRFGNQNARILA